MKVILSLCMFFFSQLVCAEGFELQKGEYHKLPPLQSKSIEIASKVPLEQEAPPQKTDKQINKELDKYCAENKKAFNLSRNKENYSYFRWRGGFFLHRQNCKNGNEKLFYIKARELKLQYKVKF